MMLRLPTLALFDYRRRYRNHNSGAPSNAGTILHMCIRLCSLNPHRRRSTFHSFYTPHKFANLPWCAVYPLQ